MADLNFNAAERPIIAFADINGDPHTFQVLPFTKSRLDATVEYQKTARALQERLDDSEDSEAIDDLQRIMVVYIDARIKSTNGPDDSITSLWQDELIEFKHLRQLGEHLQREAVGDPPA